MFEWHEDKRKANLKKHGIDFDSVWDFDWARALTLPDTRFEYGEHRLIALGYIHKKLHVCVYTMRGNNYRIISLRRANAKEEALYDEEIN